MSVMKTSDIHIRDPYILPLPDEGRYLLFGTTGKNAWSGPGLGFRHCRAQPLRPHLAALFRSPGDLQRGDGARLRRP